MSRKDGRGGTAVIKTIPADSEGAIVDMVGPCCPFIAMQDSHVTSSLAVGSPTASPSAVNPSARSSACGGGAASSGAGGRANVPCLPRHRARQPVLCKLLVDGHLDAVECGLHGIHSRPRVDGEGLGAAGLVLMEVKVNDVADLLPTAIQVPVMAIKRQLPGQPASEACLWAEVIRAPAEPHEGGGVALLVQLLPVQNCLPCPFVHGVVCQDDGHHVVFRHIVTLPLPPEGVEEHLRGGVGPSGVGAALWDRGLLSVSGQRLDLPGRWLLVGRQWHVVLWVHQIHSHWHRWAGRGWALPIYALVVDVVLNAFPGSRGHRAAVSAGVPRR
mmetsp:Transcript_464/g.1411  ORF Transcript_464/g.1411 Transcript_464/m.1411 type:complete len:329 (+) Transcript_464:1279-2265(+)